MVKTSTSWRPTTSTLGVLVGWGCFFGALFAVDDLVLRGVLLAAARVLP